MQNFLNNVADVIPHCAKVMHIVPPWDKDVILSNILGHITTVEEAFQGLNPQVSEELRAETSQILQSSSLPKPNLLKKELRALKELRCGNSKSKQ